MYAFMLSPSPIRSIQWFLTKDVDIYSTPKSWGDLGGQKLGEYVFFVETPSLAACFDPREYTYK